MLVKPNDVSWKLHHYDDPNVPLVLSDWEKLRGETLKSSGDSGMYTLEHIDIV